MKYNKEWLISQRHTLAREDFVFFWEHQDREDNKTKGCLSQWYMSPFVVDDQYYNCAEQFMMAEKALTFGDEDTRNLILAEYSQMAMKKLGRKVRNFNGYVWERNRMDVVVRGNIAKFSQNEKLKEYLLSTGDKTLVEASPKDTIWGIGLEESSPDAINPRKWNGENLLGFALMEVRDKLRGTAEKDDVSMSYVLGMWSMGAGNSGRRFNGEDPIPEKQEIATVDSWGTKPMTEYVTIQQHFHLTKKQMKVVRYGHIPDAMEDHWFMYADEDSINYYRSWTGHHIFKAKYKKDPSTDSGQVNDEYLITELLINNKKDEFHLKNVDVAVAMFYGLLVSEYGGYSSPYWRAAF